MATGVFGLNRVYKNQYQNVKNNNFASWPESGNYGYYASGSNLSSFIPRLDFSNETVSDPGKNLPAARNFSTGISNNLYGYLVAGGTPPNDFNVCTVIRLDFSTENVSLPGNDLPQRGIGIAGISSRLYGYFAGGNFAGFTSSIIRRFDFSTEIFSLPGQSLSQERWNIKSVSTNLYGYIAGGFISGFALLNTITRLDFSSETVSNPGKNLSSGRTNVGPVSNDYVGYFGGGYLNSAAISNIAKLDFSSETVSDPGKNFSERRSHAAGTSSVSYGYFGGGYQSCAISRLDFSTENLSNPGNNLPMQVAAPTGFTGGKSYTKVTKTFGYFAGGVVGVAYSTVITRLDFSSETVSNPGKNLSLALYSIGAFSNNFYGYFMGGYYSPGNSPNLVSTITRLDFSNETINNPGKNLSLARTNAVATSSNSYGYSFGGFANGNYISTITRLDFSTETINDPLKNLPSGIVRSAVMANNSYAYSAGGSIPPYTNLISRLDFSNETLSNPGNNLPLARESGCLGQILNTAYGYVVGGTNGNYISTITRLDFSSETVSDPGKNLPSATSSAAGTSSSVYGYISGGILGPQFFPLGVLSTIRRLDFATESLSTSGQNMPGETYLHTGLSNSN